MDVTGAENEIAVDSDDEPDDEIDPLKIIAHANCTEKIIKIEAPEKSLITDEDIKEIESFSKENKNIDIVELGVKNKSRLNKLIQKMEVKPIENNVNQVAELLEPHALYLCHKENDIILHKKFLPSRTSKSDVHNPEKEMARKVHKNWEATAATPPLLKHGRVKALSLPDSIEVQRECIKHVKEIQKENARVNLAQREIRMRDRILIDSLVDDAPFFSDYRGDKGPNSDSDDEEEMDSEDEVNDEPEEKGGGVVYSYSQ